MTATSRPLRALGVILGGWTAARVIALWPVAGAVIDAPVTDVARAEPAQVVVAITLDDNVPLFAGRPLSTRGMNKSRQAQELAARETMAETGAVPVKAKPGHLISISSPRAQAARAVAPGLPVMRPPSRFSGSAWALMRGEGAPSLANGGQLGGSQIGMRLFYTPGPETLAVTARISGPLSQPGGREAAIGLALRGRNIGLIAEQRFSLDKGGRDAPAVFVYGGVSDVKVGSGAKLDGYVQAGVVGVKDPAAFVDGAVRIDRDILKAEHATLSVGAGLWGGAQPGVARLDVGPQIVARVRVAETNLRVSAEWRQRIAGDAAPTSGPSVTLGFDF